MKTKTGHLEVKTRQEVASVVATLVQMFLWFTPDKSKKGKP